jgi:hypothetical protein
VNVHDLIAYASVHAYGLIALQEIANAICVIAAAGTQPGIDADYVIADAGTREYDVIAYGKHAFESGE